MSTSGFSKTGKPDKLLDSNILQKKTIDSLICKYPSIHAENGQTQTPAGIH